MVPGEEPTWDARDQRVYWVGNYWDSFDSRLPLLPPEFGNKSSDENPRKNGSGMWNLNVRWRRTFKIDSTFLYIALTMWGNEVNWNRTKWMSWAPKCCHISRLWRSPSERARDPAGGVEVKEDVHDEIIAIVKAKTKQWDYLTNRTSVKFYLC